jgi:acyl carrier protein
MFDYLKKFNQLPKDLRDKVSSPAAVEVINDLEKEYGVTLAAVVMKVMAKEVKISDLEKYFIEYENFSVEKSEKIVLALKAKVFKRVEDYLGMAPEEREEKVPAPLETNTKEVAPLGKGANFFFSSEDEEEIRELTKKINGNIKGVAEEEIEKKLNKVINSAQINFGSQELQDRFKSILRVYLRGVRDRIETKQTLKKTFVGGGLGFDSDSVDKVMEIADSVKGGEDVSLKAPLKIRLPEDGIKKDDGGNKVAGLKDIGVRDIDYDFSGAKAKKAEEKTAPPSPKEKKLDVSHELAPPPPSIFSPDKQPKKMSVRKEKPEATASKIAVKKPTLIPMEKFELKRNTSGKTQYRSPGEAAGKKKMEDVKYIPPKVMNPIDELRYIDLVNFRRLASDPQKQVMRRKLIY